MAYPYQRYVRGFTLLELAAVILIIGVIAASSALVLRSTLDSSEKAATEMTLTNLETALKAHKEQFGRLPCPADPWADLANTSAGVEEGDPGDCAGGGVLITTGAAEGGVPFTALGLPASAALDAYGAKIIYAVNPVATRTNATRNYGPHTTCSTGINVQDATATNRNETTNLYAYVLLSMGKNSHGAYSKTGTRIYTGSTNTSEWQNCNCNATTTTAYNNTYIDRDEVTGIITTQYNDIIRYGNFSTLSSAEDIKRSGSTTCTQVQTINPATALYTNAIAMGDINGDGYDDIVTSDPNADNGAANSGSIFIIYGNPSGIPTDIDYTTPDGRRLSRIDGGVASVELGKGSPDGHGRAALTTGDINGDGYSDIIALGVETGTETLYVVYGSQQTVTTSDIQDLTVDGKGFTITGAWVLDSHRSLLTGDLNADGFDDIVHIQDKNTTGFKIVFGKALWADTNTISFDGQEGFSTTSSDSPCIVGGGVAIGDINADKIDDLLIGETCDGVDAGKVHVLLGRKTGWQDDYEVGHGVTRDITFTASPSETNYDMFGDNLSTGDFNGDGNGDVAVGSVSATTVVLFGATNLNSSNTVSSIYLDTGSEGIRLINNTTKVDINFMKDVNGDKIDDVFLPHSSDTPSVDDYIVAGTSTAFTVNDYELETDAPYDNLNSGTLLSYLAAVDTPAWGIAGGDINGDGLGDIAFGSTTGSDAIYIIYGQPKTWVTGTNAY